MFYFIVTLIATVIGAIAGLGGGIIIKPTFDALGGFDVSTIGILSSITVLCMAFISTAKYIKSGIKLDFKIVILSMGAVIGGFLGKIFFDFLYKMVVDSTAKGIQAIMLIILLVFVLFRKLYPHFNIKNKSVILIVGLVMGMVSSFLGIGGGPINVVAICIVFSVSVRDAAIYSIFVILFSQLSNVIATAITPGLQSYNLSVLIFMIPAAILGAFIGSYLNRKLSEKFVEYIFNTVMIIILLMNIYNTFTFIISR